MKRLSKTLAVFLCLAMLISCIPGVVFTAKATEATITQPQGVSIVENYDSYVGEDWVAQLGMPAKVTTSDGEADVQWADAAKYVDLKTPGYYFVPGTVNGVAQAVYFPVQVRAYENVFPAGRNHDFESNLQKVTVNDDPATEDVDESTLAHYVPAYWALTYGNYNLTQTALVDSKLPNGGQAVKLVKAKANYEVMYSSARSNIVNVIKELGVGQYYFGIWGWSDVDSTTKFYVNVEHFYGNVSSNTSKVSVSGEYLPFSTEPQKAGCVTTVETLNDGTTDLGDIIFRIAMEKTSLVDGGMYFDSAEMVLLKTALTEVPPVITAVTSEIPAYSVIKDYDTYAGENWKEVLGLPAEVDVTLDNGGTGKASVEWDYSKLDLTTPGWYVLPGKVTSDDYVMKADMTVQQVIKVTEYDNLLANNAHVCNFEKTKTDGGFTLPEYWPVNKLSGAYPFDAAATKQVQSKVPNGGNAFMFTPTAYRRDILYSGSTVRFLGKEIYALGAGQYHFSINAWSDNENGSVMFLRVRTYYGAYSGENNTNGSSTTPTTQCWANILVDNRVTLTSDVQQPSVIASIDTTDASKSDIDYVYVEVDYTKMTDGAFYLDELCVLPLKVEVTEVPAIVTKVTSTMTTLSVIKDYDTYVGNDWQTALGLPTQVDVALSNNATGKADVTWDLTTLDVSKLGRYVVTGTVSSDEYIITDELTVEQVIYIQEYENMLTSTRNPNFDVDVMTSTNNEGKVSGWSATWSVFDLTQTEVLDSKVPNGGKATKVVMNTNRSEFMYSNGYYDLTAKMKEYGDGQYFFGAWGWSDTDTTELYYLSLQFDGSTTIPICTPSNNQADGAVYFTTEPQQSTYVTNITGTSNIEVNKTRAIFRLNRQAEAGGTYYLDEAQVLPLVTYMPNLVEPTIKNASLALQNNLAIKYTALADKFGTDFTDPYVVFTMNGEETTVEGVADGDSYVFWFKNIAPHEIADNITATLHATFNGVDVELDTRDYSVLTYCKNKMGEGDAKLDTLLADLINYGVELQKALGQEPLDTTDLDLSAATATDRELVSKLQFVGEPDNAATWKSASLILNDTVTVRLTFKTELDISNVTVEIQAAGNTWNLVPVKDESAENTYYVDFNGLNAAQMSEEIYAEVNDGDTAVSCALLYSVETYAYNKQATNLGNLVKAMMKYGDSAAAYAS